MLQRRIAELWTYFSKTNHKQSFDYQTEQPTNELPKNQTMFNDLNLIIFVVTGDRQPLGMNKKKSATGA